jgi:hypothetical protein
MTGTIPTDRKAVIAICRNMFEKFLGVTYLPSVKTEKIAQMASNAKTIAYVCILARNCSARFEIISLKDPFEFVFIETTPSTMM